VGLLDVRGEAEPLEVPLVDSPSRSASGTVFGASLKTPSPFLSAATAA